MSRKRDRLVALRKRLIVGEPPFQRDQIGSFKRAEGVPGIEERKAIGNFHPDAAGLLLVMETLAELLDTFLETAR